MDIEKISKYLLTTVLKLLKGVPDLWRADVSRIIKELKEMAELESHAGERQRSVIRAHREFLIDEAAERLAYETYTRKGLRFWANQQELVCGYFRFSSSEAYMGLTSACCYWSVPCLKI